MTSVFGWVIQLIYILAASCFVLGLHLMNNPATARHGNQVSTAGMATAIATTLAIVVHDGRITATGWTVMLTGALVGGAAGLYFGPDRADDRDAAAGQRVQRRRRRCRCARRHPRLHARRIGGFGDDLGDNAARRHHRCRDVLGIDRRGREAARPDQLGAGDVPWGAVGEHAARGRRGGHGSLPDRRRPAS